MKNILRLEEAAMFGLAFFLGSQLPFQGWVFWAWLLVPDLSMIGYLVNTRIGAILYNIVHHKALAIGLYILGFWLNNPELTLVGVVLFAHSSMDRVFGYGLKYADDFKHTHLGWIGKQ
jgi:hypothetical protein